MFAYEHRRDERRFRAWLRRNQSGSALQTAAVLRVDGRDLACRRVGAGDPDVEYALIGMDSAEVSESSVGIMLSVARVRDADIVYCDEHVIGAFGPSQPYFKPGFSPELLYEEDYVGPVVLVRMSALSRLLRRDSASVSVYLLLLRAVELGLSVWHAPGAWVAYRSPRSRSLAEDDAERLQAHLRLRRRRAPLRRPDDTVDASVIIPTRDRIELLEPCIVSVYERAGTSGLEVIVVDNGSNEAASVRWLSEAPKRFDRLRVVRLDEPFNWSRLNNFGRREASGRVAVFLNNDVEIRSDRWLDGLVESAVQPDLGVIGAMMTYPDGSIQHAGVVIGIGGLADHIYSGVPAIPDDGHMFVDPFVSRNVLCCTGACMAIDLEKFDHLGGFDEGFAITGDVELCIRAYRRGWRNLYNAKIRMTHFESATRVSQSLPVQEVEKLRESIAEFVTAGDPFYNPALSKRGRYPSYLE